MRPAIKITLIYIVLGIIWIVVSDNAAEVLFEHSQTKEKSFQLFKGIFYVCLTGFLLYFLIARYQKKLESKVRELKRLNLILEKEKEKIKKSNEQLENFADTASHDLKSPLRTISTLIQRFQTKFKDQLTDDSNNYLEIIEDSSKKLYEKINETLRFSKVHHYKENYETVDLNSLIKSIESNIEIVINEKDTQLNYDDLPTIKSAQSLLNQVFQNLIDNAVKYSKPDTQAIINIKSKEFKNKWKFCVQDNGIGIDKENHEKIFKKHHRINNDKEKEGSGIGLSIVKEIIEKLHGEIWVESTLGEGTAVYFTLPKN